jgi:hypothetical protein
LVERAFSLVSSSSFFQLLVCNSNCIFEKPCYHSVSNYQKGN